MPPTAQPKQRLLDNWLVSYHQYTRNNESPDMFHLWTGLWTMAGALQRKVWLPYNLTRNIYPNLFVVLVAPPGAARKGAALGVGKSLLSQLNVPLVASSITGPALVQLCTEAGQHYERSNPAAPSDVSQNIAEMHNSVSLCSDEMATFFGKDNSQMMDILTDWFDCPSPWEHRTVTRGSNRIDAVWFNLLSATTPDSLASFMPAAVVGGGFSSRVIWVYEEGSRPRVAFPTLDEELGLALAHDLTYINQKILGPATFSPAARDFWIEWYEGGTWDAGVEDPAIKYYLNRKPTQVMKIAMCCHFAYSDTMEIEVQDLKMAINAIERLEPNMPKVFRAAGLNKFSTVQDRVLAYIIKHAPNFPNRLVPEARVLDTFACDLDVRSLQMITDTLVKLGRIRSHTASGYTGYTVVEQK
jgi:hypothetical protein